MTLDWQDGAQGWLTADGKSLEYACFGPPPDAAPTLILLHEGLGSRDLWRDFPAQLAAATGFGVLAYSRAGYGASDPVPLPRPLDYMTAEATGPLPDILHHIGPQKAMLIGHSDGATIAAIHAGTCPHPALSAIVLIAPHFFAEPAGLSAIAAAKTAYDTGDLKPRLARHHSNVDTAFKGWNDAWLDPDFENWTVAEVLDTIKTPILAIQGRDDQYGTPAQITEISQRQPTAETHLLPDCKHAPHAEHPETTLRLIAQFALRHCWRPPHAHIPGQTPRHPETLFDPLKTDTTLAWHMGLSFLREGFFWEAHEMHETVWLAQPPNSAEREMAQAVIQLANAALKRRMNRPEATRRLTERARSHLAEALNRKAEPVLGLTQATFENLQNNALSWKSEGN